VGTWRIVDIETRPVAGGGSPTYPIGRNLTGYIVYGSDGRMHAQIMHGDAVRPPRDAAGEMPIEQQAGAFRTYIAFFGGYTVDEQRGTIVHHVEGDLNPRNIGNDDTRFIELSDARLSLNTYAQGPQGERLITRRVLERAK
jgi:hypothetical protein